MSSNRVRGILKIPVEDGLQDEIMQKKHAPPEAQCIIYILRTHISNVETAAILPAILRLNDGSSDVDRELSRALQKHQVLEERLEKLEGPELESEEKSVTAQLKKDVKDSFRNLLRLFRANPDSISDWKEELEKEIGVGENALIKELSRLHNCIVKKFFGHVDQESHTGVSQQLSLSSNEEEDFTALIEEDFSEHIEKDLSAHIEKIDAKISQKNREIQSLQSSLQKKRQEVSVVVRLQQEIGQRSTQLNKLILNNRQAEETVKQKNKEVERETELVIQDFDNNMEELQAKLELNEMEYEMESEELKKLVMQISELDAEYKDILERRRLAAEKKDEEEKELELKTRAAFLAQAWWRGYCVRKALKKKDKRNKPREGKGKKTK